MRYTTDDKGILNNYAVEPQVYVAEYPSVDKQRSYAIQGAVAFVLISLLVLTAFSVS